MTCLFQIGKPNDEMTGAKKILVLGGNSFVGRHLCIALGPKRVVATWHRQPLPGGIQFDACTQSLENIVKSPEDFSHAVILTAIANPEACMRDPEGARQLNVDRTAGLLAQLHTQGITAVFASSETVFGDDAGGYTEEDPVSPQTLYGRLKAEIEDHIRETYKAALIVRLGRVVGVERGDGTLLTGWAEELAQNRDIRCAEDQFFSPISITTVTDAIVRLVEQNHNGLFNVCGNDGLSRIAMLEKLIKTWRGRYGYDGKVTRCSIDDFPTSEPRQHDTTMRPDKLIMATGIKIPSFDDICSKLVANWY